MGLDRPEQKAIILAAYGTAYPAALPDLLAIKTRMAFAFPRIPIRLTFTSNRMRRFWRDRRADPDRLSRHPNLPKEILEIKGPLATIADLQDSGYDVIVVQSLHIYAGEAFKDLKSIVEALRSIRTLRPGPGPFDGLALGRPALGGPGLDHDEQADIDRAARAVAADVDRARDNRAALVYMGHGHSDIPSEIYQKFQMAVRRIHPGHPILIGVMAGEPSLDQVLDELKAMGADKVMLAPFLFLAGGHVRRDMAGDHPGSWKMKMRRAGLEVDCLLRGLAALDAWAALSEQHIKDAMRAHGVG